MRILHIYTMYIIHIYWIERGSGCLSCFGREPKSFLSRDLAVGGIWHAMKRGLAQNIAKLYSFFHKTAFGRLDTNCQVRCDGGLGGGDSVQIRCAFRSCGVSSVEFSVSKAASVIEVTSFAE